MRHRLARMLAAVRRRGAHSVVLTGASLGGTAVVAAAHAVPPPVAVVDVSGEDDLSGVDALGAAPGSPPRCCSSGRRMIPWWRRCARSPRRPPARRSTTWSSSRGRTTGSPCWIPALEPQAARLCALILDFTRQNTGQR